MKATIVFEFLLCICLIGQVLYTHSVIQLLQQSYTAVTIIYLIMSKRDLWIPPPKIYFPQDFAFIINDTTSYSTALATALETNHL